MRRNPWLPFLPLLLLVGCATPQPPKAEPEAAKPAPFARADLTGDGRDESIYTTPGQAPGSLSRVEVQSEAGNALLALTPLEGGDIKQVALMRAGAPSPLLLVSRLGGSGGGLVDAYLYNPVVGKLERLHWGNQLSALGQAVQGEHAIIIRTRFGDRVYRYQDGLLQSQ